MSHRSSRPPSSWGAPPQQTVTGSVLPLKAHSSQSRSLCTRAKCRAEALAVLPQCCSSLLGTEHASFPSQWLPLCRLTKSVRKPRSERSPTDCWARWWQGPTGTGEAIHTTTKAAVHLQLAAEGKRDSVVHSLDHSKRKETGRRGLRHSRSLLVSRCCQA